MLHLKYRPNTLDEVVGNKETITSLQSILSRGAKHRPRVYLFSGPSGCGKTTLARIMSNEMGVKSLDLMEANSANFRGIDYVRDLIQSSHLSPMHGKRRAWILDECQQMTKEAQSALLKVLEDTPEHVLFFLCTTDPTKLLPTILNRCSRYMVQLLPDKDMEKLLTRVMDGEDKKIPEGVQEGLIENSHGSPRQMLTFLDRIIDLLDDPEACETLLKHDEELEAGVSKLCRALLKGAKWPTIAKILTALKGVEGEEGIRRAVMGYCSAIMMGGKDGHQGAYLIATSFMEPFYNNGWPGLVVACYEAAVANRK